MFHHRWFTTGRRGAVAVIVALSVLASGLTLGQPLLLNSVMADASAGLSLNTATILILVALIVALTGIVIAKARLQSRLAEKVGFEHRERMVRSIARCDSPSASSVQPSNYVSSLTSDVDAIKSVFSAGLLEVPAHLLLAVFSLLAMIYFDPLGTAIAVATIGCIAVGSLLVGGRIGSLTRRRQDRLADGARDADELLRHHQLVAVNNLQKQRADVLLKDYSEAAAAGTRIGQIQGLMAPLNELAVSVTLLAVLGLGGMRVALGQLELADLVTFVLYFGMLATPVGAIANAYVAAKECQSARDRYQECLDRLEEDERLPDLDDARWTDRAPAASGATGDLVLDDVTLNGRPGARPRLDRVTARIPQGSFTAVVGLSGAGKSSLMATLTRAERPCGGRVLLGEVPLEEIPLLDYRDRIGYVDQEHGLAAWGATGLAATGAQPDADTATRLQQLLEGIHGTPASDSAGQTRAMLSGGERQRMAIAHAFQGGKDLLFMDEPTSNLDGASERRVVDLIDSRPPGMTAVVIAHRLSTVLSADHVLVLDAGRLVAAGTHDHLVRASPDYRKLWGAAHDADRAQTADRFHQQLVKN